MRAFIRHAPRSSAYFRSLYGDTADWTIEAQLLALVSDQLAGANWQRGGGKGPRPKPIPRPGNEGQTIGGKRLFTADELDRMLGYSPRKTK